MSSHSSVAKALKLLGKVSLTHVQNVNKSTGEQWVSAINIAGQAVQADVSILFVP